MGARPLGRAAGPGSPLVPLLPPRPWQGPRSAPAPCSVAAAVAGYVLMAGLSDFRYRQAWDAGVNRTYWANVLHDLGGYGPHADRLDLLDSTLPDATAIIAGYPTDLVSYNFVTLGERMVVGDPDRTMQVVAADGHLVRGAISVLDGAGAATAYDAVVTAPPLTPATFEPTGGSGTNGPICARSGSLSVDLILPKALEFNFYSLDIGYRAAGGATGGVSVGVAGSYVGTAPLTLPADQTSAVVDLTPAPVGTVRISVAAPRGMCVDRMSIGLPVVAG